MQLQKGERSVTRADRKQKMTDVAANPASRVAMVAAGSSGVVRGGT